MQIRRKTGFFALFLITAFSLFACGGGGGGDNPPPPPTSTTVATTGISLHTATLNGTVNPNAQATNAWFEWGTDSTLSTPTLTPPQAIGAGSADNSVSASITGLTLGTTYYYRVAATNASGTQKGAIASFTTASPNSPPSVTTSAASSVTISGAVLNGTVSPNELATTAVFEWGTDSNLTTFTSTSSQPVGAGTTSVAITASLSGLNPVTKYYFRVVATNSAGTSRGTIVSFDTVAQAPAVVTGAPTSITPSGATLNGTVNPNGLAVTDAHFEYGTDPNLTTPAPTSTTAQPLAAGFTGQAINAPVTGLIPGTTYYFRVAATNSAGTSKGTPPVSFLTPQYPPPIASAGPDQSVFMLGPMGSAVGLSGPTVVTLDGSASSGQGGGTITSYQWTQIAGISSVTLSGPTSATPTFLAPAVPHPTGDNLVFQLTVTDNRGLSGTDNVKVTVKWGFLDDFSTDTTGTYSVATTGTGGTFTFDPVGKRALVQTGVSNTLTFSKRIPPNTGVFSLDFSPTTESGSGGDIEIFLADDADTYYIFSTREAAVRKVRVNVTVDNVAFPNSYSQGGGPYHIKISYSPTITTVEAFGGTVNLTANDMSNPVNFIMVRTTQQNAYYDNIKLGAPPVP